VGLLDASAEAAIRELDLDAVARLDGIAGADDLVAGADDRVATLERRLGRKGAQAAGAVLQLGPTPLEQQARSTRVGIWSGRDNDED